MHAYCTPCKVSAAAIERHSRQNDSLREELSAVQRRDSERSNVPLKCCCARKSEPLNASQSENVLRVAWRPYCHLSVPSFIQCFYQLLRCMGGRPAGAAVAIFPQSIILARKQTNADMSLDRLTVDSTSLCTCAETNQPPRVKPCGYSAPLGSSRLRSANRSDNVR